MSDWIYYVWKLFKKYLKRILNFISYQTKRIFGNAAELVCYTCTHPVKILITTLCMILMMEAPNAVDWDMVMVFSKLGIEPYLKLFIEKLPVNLSYLHAVKIVTGLVFLIVMRAGSPRFRLDFITQIGWKKLLQFSIMALIWLLILAAMM